MSITLTPQDDTGEVAGANGYIDPTFFAAYHVDRGNTYTATSDQIKIAIIRATDHIDTVNEYKGERLADDQTTEFPRAGLTDGRGGLIEGLPLNLQKACAEYGLRALSAQLIPDSDDPTVGGSIKRTRSKVDVIEDEIEYTDGGGPGSRLPAYPAADLLLRAYVVSGGGGGKLVR